MGRRSWRASASRSSFVVALVLASFACGVEGHGVARYFVPHWRECREAKLLNRGTGMSSRYDEIYRRSLANPNGFWGEAAEAIHWEKRWDKVLDDSRPPFYRWFRGGRLNTCYNALDRHVAEGRGEQLALIYDSPVTNQ